MNPLRTRPGSPSPLGATWDGSGTNFAVYSEGARGVDLCLFDSEEKESRVRLQQRTEFVWHQYVEGVGPGQLYALRVDGPWEPSLGHRFNHHNLLIDPYTRAVTGPEDWSKGAFSYDVFHPDKDRARAKAEQLGAPYGVVVDPAFDWEGDAAPGTPLRKTVIYETHVKGLTMMHPEVPQELRGTFAAVGSEPIIKYLVDLGVTAVELLPVHHFVDDLHLLEKGLRNYWGYNSIAFFAPDVRYRSGTQVGAEVRQFKAMVRALHAAGIEVILDVVYNHTAEGNHLGPTLSLKGVDNRTYYRLVTDNPRYYFDYTGTGNTLNVHHPQTLRLVMDSLRYWVSEMHVDGFRFDLASTLARSLHEVDRLSSFFTVLSQDPALAKVKLIAEPWDMGEGGYQVGHFPPRWSEWNAEYRDALRAFWRGDRGRAGQIGYRLTGSADLYGNGGRKPSASINFVSAHDGMTLRDLVCYGAKHNEANGEGNKDGVDDDLSSNGGVEGETDDPTIRAYRARQQRNLLASLLFSRGTPMICGGDEIGRTQKGNNNAYCHDDATTWYDWALDDERKRLHAFVRKAIRLRREHPLFHLDAFIGGPAAAAARGARDAEWFRHDGAKMTEQDWKNDGTSSLALYVPGAQIEGVDEEGRKIADDDLLLVLNASELDLDFILPSLDERGRGARWRLLLDTVDDDAREETLPESPTRMQARSLKLFARGALAPAGIDAAYGAPTSTYRLQLHKGFGFRAALDALDYLHALGVGGVYSSPILRARAGSTHGYDVVDHSSLNPELGSREDFDELTRELARRGMKYLLDFVPNHMGVAGGENAWWNDVLENGPASLYADFFDIDWAPPTGTLKDKVLLPVLGSQFGEELDSRSVSVARAGGALVVRYQESSFPASPRSYRIVLERALESVPLAKSEPACEELESIVASIRHLPAATSALSPDDRASRARSNGVMKRRLASLTASSSEVSTAIDGAIRELNEGAEKLEAFLLEQNYRLASWRVASDETNYRRFFDLNDLAAIRMEDARVFTEAHRLVFELIAAGQVSGLRLDHTDGLYDPCAYFSALREGAARALAGAGRAASSPLYVIAEKILGQGEEVPTTWAISGTTGYDFLVAANGLWVAPESEAELSALYAEFADVNSYERVAYGSKRAILRGAVSSEVHMLAHQLKEIADGRRDARDFSFLVLLRVLEEALAAFPVYRSYVRPDGTRQPNDEAHVLGALATARRRSRLVDRSVFDFLRSVLLVEDRSEPTARVAMRFQQLTGPLAAKGIEDTASYRYGRLLSNNEVGCDPSHFASDPAVLHAHNMAMLARWPLTMTATTTHDTKRSEDVRARLAVLSELPGEWRGAVARFHACLERYVETVDGEPAPSRLDEYFFFQSAVGAYPFGGLAEGDREAFSGRLTAYMTKATHEGKLRTSWLAPHAEYDGAVSRFLKAALGDAAFLKELDAFVALLLPHGASNSLAQLALRLASPGVPDIYQGAELWDLSLVDPDNRRPVDFGLRRAILGELAGSRPSPTRAQALVSSYKDGRMKMHVLVEALRLRGKAPDLFLDGSYRPLDAPCPHVVAFERALRGRRLVVVAPRLTRVLTGRTGFALGDDWGDQELDLGAAATWRNLFTSQSYEGGKLRLGTILQYFPVAWLDSA